MTQLIDETRELLLKWPPEGFRELRMRENTPIDPARKWNGEQIACRVISDGASDSEPEYGSVFDED